MPTLNSIPGGKILRFFQGFKKSEKIILLSATIAILASMAGLYFENLSKKQMVASDGGHYTEGILIQNKAELDDELSKLTGLGLTRFDEARQVQPAIATSWKISSDNLTYDFTLDKRFKASQMLEQLKINIPDVDIVSSDENHITIHLKEPYAPLLAETTHPIANAGPYKLSKQDKTSVTLDANKDYVLGRPHIDEIVIKKFPDKKSLEDALQNEKIQGAGDELIDNKNFNHYSVTLLKYSAVFFNLRHPVLQDIGVRKALVNGSRISKPVKLNLLVPDVSEYKSKVSDLLQKWQGQGFEITVTYADLGAVTHDYIPTRNFDMLFYGLDYGNDPDPFAFWHSSQINTGLNLSGYKNTDVDKLIEEARSLSDAKERTKRYNKIKTILESDAPALILPAEKYDFTVSKTVKSVTNIAGSTGADRFTNIHLWYINTTH